MTKAVCQACLSSDSSPTLDPENRDATRDTCYVCALISAALEFGAKRAAGSGRLREIKAPPLAP